jgi:hypothetical protein
VTQVILAAHDHWYLFDGYSQGTTGYTSDRTASLTGNLPGTITLAYQTPSQCICPNDAQTHRPGDWSPQAVLGRAVSVTAAASATDATATVNGYDIYGYPMSGSRSAISAGSVVTGKKAFKYIKSVVLSGGTADTTHAYSVGTADVFGLPLAFGYVRRHHCQQCIRFGCYYVDHCCHQLSPCRPYYAIGNDGRRSWNLRRYFKQRC